MLDLHAANLRTVNWMRAAPPGVELSYPATVNKRFRRLLALAIHRARQNGVSLDDLQGPSRVRAISWPRQDFMLAARELGFSLTEIGRFLNRDHTTILKGVRAAEKRRTA